MYKKLQVSYRHIIRLKVYIYILYIEISIILFLLLRINLIFRDNNVTLYSNLIGDT